MYILSSIPKHELFHNLAISENHSTVIVTFGAILFVLSLIIDAYLAYSHRYTGSVLNIFIIEAMLVLICTVFGNQFRPTYDTALYFQNHTIRTESHIRNNLVSDIPFYRRDLKHYYVLQSHLKKPYQHEYRTDINYDKAILRQDKHYDSTHAKYIKRPWLDFKIL